MVLALESRCKESNVPTLRRRSRRRRKA